VRAVTARGGWIWGLSGLATAAVLAVPAVRLLGHPGLRGDPAIPSATLTRTVTVSQPITSLNVQSPGEPVRVVAGSGPDVRVTEVFSYARPDGPPKVQDSVAGGHLSLAAPACVTADCGVSFTVTVPAAVFATVTSNGGPVTVSGVAGADVDSGGAPVTLRNIHGPLTVATDGGGLGLNGQTGEIHADTGGGPMAAARIDGQTTISTDGGALSVTGLTGLLEADSGGGPAYLFDVTAQTATVTTGGGAGRLQFDAAPGSVVLSTDGGPAQLDVPRGPYALTSDSDGGPVAVTIATSPSASRTLAVTSGGGLLQVDHASGTR
jgi:hypothetical protein